MKKTIFLGFCLVFLFGFIHSQTITVKSPHSGDTWYKGNTYTITWTKTGNTGVNVKINIFKDLIIPTNCIDQLPVPNSGSQSWTIPSTYANGTYYIRIKGADSSWNDIGVYGDSKAFTVIKILIKQSPFMEMKKPVIKSVLPIPVGALTPGTQLFIKGKYFGTQRGEILMYGNFPNSFSPGPIQFIKVTWESSTQVNGFVHYFSDNGQLDQIVEIRVKRANGRLSKPWKIKFKGRKAHKVVLRNDVVVLHCGDDGNCNVCNNIVHKDSDIVWTLCPNTFSICGYHYNIWGAVGDDKGYDKYKISLKNGWVFKSMQRVKWEKSSGDEVLNGPYPPLPVGKSNWTPKIHWKVSPNDRVKYRLKIIVEGPLGTHYK